MLGEASYMNDEVVWVNEGFVMNDAGHGIATSYVDLRHPEVHLRRTTLRLQDGRFGESEE